MAVPVNAGFAEVAAAVELDAADAAFDEAAGHETVIPKVAGNGLVEAVERAGGGGFGADVGDFGGAELHAGGEFITPDAGDQGIFAGVLA